MASPRAAAVATAAALMMVTIAAAATPTTTMTSLAAAAAATPTTPPLPPRLAAKHAAAKAQTLALLSSVERGRRGKGGGADTSECEAPGYRNRVLGLLHEANFLGLFKDLKNQTKLEASGMDVVGDDLWVVFDNTPLVGLLDLHFAYEDPHNSLIPPVVGSSGGAGNVSSRAGRAPPTPQLPPPLRRRLMGQSDSQFEGISAIHSRPGEFMIIEEMREVSSNGGDDDDEPGIVYHPFAQRVALSRAHPDGYRVLERCAVHLVLTRENKGVEGIEYIEDTKGKGWLLAACEGNWCEGGRRGRDRGNGKVAVLEFSPGTQDEPCGWHVVKTLDIPPGAAFEDYSDLAFADPGFRGERKEDGKGAVAVLSQEDAALWVGQFDYNKMEFDPEVAGAAFVLPKDGSCRSIWCNAEGLAWLDSRRLAVATDRAKASQSFICTAKDEAIGTFALPDGADRAIFGGGGGEVEGEEEGLRVEVV